MVGVTRLHDISTALMKFYMGKTGEGFDNINFIKLDTKSILSVNIIVCCFLCKDKK